jgi:DNA-binding response OmpR family regulator
MAPHAHTILLVEDDADGAEALRAILEGEGYVVRLAGDGRQGQKAIEQGGVDLVLTDILMPNQDGLEMLLACRRHNAQMPVIAMSGGSSRMPEMDLPKFAGMLGARAGFAKPLNLPLLLSTIAGLLPARAPSA